MPMKQPTIDTPPLKMQQNKQIYMGSKSIEVFFLALQSNQNQNKVFFRLK